MLKLRIIQANYGDSFLLQYGTASNQKYFLVDGGPKGTYQKHLRHVLELVSDDTGQLEMIAISHVDGDHITGILDLFAKLESQRANDETALVDVKGLWLNSFGTAIDVENDLQVRLSQLLASPSAAMMSTASHDLMGIGQGHRLRTKALQLQVPINDGFPNGLICVDDANDRIQMDNLTIRIVGPTRANLGALKLEWQEWLDRNEDGIMDGNASVLANSDRSVPNLSSIMMLVEAEGKSILFTGDGRSDHLLEGLEQANLLDQGKLHVDVLKVPHHGSDRNATKRFFRKVTADTYVISANGHPDNPDLSTLIWIVETAHEASRPIKIMATNRRNTFRKLQEEYDPAIYGYEVQFMPEHYHYWDLSLL